MDESDREFVRAVVQSAVSDFKDEMAGLRLEMRAGFNETNANLEKTNIRLDAAISMTRDFRIDVSKRLDTIGEYMNSGDTKFHGHEQRIDSLERRVDRLEDAG